MATHNVFYAIFLPFMIIIFSVCISLQGCSIKYDYSTINTSNFSLAHSIDQPNIFAEQELSPQNINNLENISVNNNVITINNPTLTNYIINDLHNYIFIFETDAFITINKSLHSTYSTFFISTADNLYININATISSGTSNTILPPNISVESSISANTLFIFGEGSITSSNSCIKCNNLFIASQKLDLSADTAAIYSTNLDICSGENNISAPLGLSCQNLSFLGGTTYINSAQQAINATSISLENGVIYIKSETAIHCNNFTKTSGYLVIEATNGILCQNAEINGGYLYTNCKIVGIKSIYALSFTGGISIFVATTNQNTAIDAETANFNVFGGTVISNSTYACAPQNNALFFSATSNNLFVLQSNKKQLVYIAQTTGSLMVAGDINYNYYSTNGKLNSFNNNFYGLLLEASVNTYSHKYINQNTTNFGATIYNGEYIQNGQLF